MINSSDILHGKILIVDDREVNIQLLERMLRGAGYDSITSTMEPGEVRALHFKNRYDLILLDLQMQGMDGFQVMEELKKIEMDNYLPVLVITAQPGHKLHALQAGAKDFISKPFDLTEVLARVHNMLEVRLLHKELHKYNELLEQQVLEQATLLAISHTLASTLELQPGLILDQLHEIIEFMHGGLFALAGSELVSLAVRGIENLNQSSPIQVSLNNPENINILLNNHIPILIADVWSDDLHAQFLRSILVDESAVLLEGMKSLMWVPLAVMGRLIGGIYMAHEKQDFFTSHHADLALSVANQASITMINAELNGQAQALAVLEERQRLAHNLHDAVNQSLFSAGLIADVLPLLWDQDQEDARRSLEELRLLMRGVQAEMRALLAELRPSTLTESDLGKLLQLLGIAFEGRTNLPVVVTVSREFILPTEVQIAFYRVCQEALNNIAKHAKASQVEIDLKQNDVVVELSIRDDGIGFDTAQTFTGHYGLSMMRERAEAAGLLMTITSEIGQGTEVAIRWGTTIFAQSTLLIGAL